MYDDIIHLAMDQQLLTEIGQNNVNYRKLPLWKELQKKEDMTEFEAKLEEAGQLTFDKIFNEPVGFHLMRSFLESEHSVDKVESLSPLSPFARLSLLCPFHKLPQQSSE